MTCPYSGSEKELTADEKLQAVVDSKTDFVIQGEFEMSGYNLHAVIFKGFRNFRSKEFDSPKDAINWLYNETVGES